MLGDLRTLLENLEEHPSNEDFYNIWIRVLCISKDGFDGMLTELLYYIEDYLHEYEYQRYHHFGGRKSVSLKSISGTCHNSMHNIGEAL